MINVQWFVIIALRNHEISSHIIQFGTFFVYRSPGQRWRRPFSAMWLAACKLGRWKKALGWLISSRDCTTIPAIMKLTILRIHIDRSTSKMGGDTVEVFFRVSMCFNLASLHLGCNYIFFRSTFLKNIHKNRNHIEVPGSESTAVGKSDGELRYDQFGMWSSNDR